MKIGLADGAASDAAGTALREALAYLGKGLDIALRRSRTLIDGIESSRASREPAGLGGTPTAGMAAIQLVDRRIGGWLLDQKGIRTALPGTALTTKSVDLHPPIGPAGSHQMKAEWHAVESDHGDGAVICLVGIWQRLAGIRLSCILIGSCTHDKEYSVQISMPG